MGRSFPSFAHEECSLFPNGNVPSEFEQTNYGDEESVRLRLQPYKNRVQTCWTCTTCDYLFENIEQPLDETLDDLDNDGGDESLDDDGSASNIDEGSTNFIMPEFDKEELNATDTLDFHFLEYSGTRQLVEDIERIRILFNSPKMNVLGVSYGTSVFGAYASIFPNSVGLMVLDSTIDPFPNLYDKARTGAIGLNEHINYLVYSCNARNFLEPGSCPVSDISKCIGDVNSFLIEVGDFVPGNEDTVTIIQELIGALYESSSAQEICDAAANRDVETFESLVGVSLGIEEESTPDTGDSSSTTIGGAATPPSTVRETEIVISPSKPTLASSVQENPNYEALMSTELPLTLVRAQDNVAEGSYDEYFFAREVVNFNYKYTGAGTGRPASYFFNLWSHAFYWPRNKPIPPIGNPFLTGIISGSLYDSTTPYRWTQTMRSQFPSTHLLTSQTINHGLLFLEGGDTSCNDHIIKYLELGYPNFVDGTICGSEGGNDAAAFATESDFFDAFDIEL